MERIGFFSLDRVNGLIREDGSGVRWLNGPADGEASLAGVFPDGTCLVQRIGRYDLDEYLEGRMKQRFYRFDPESGEKKELFTAWPDHGQIGNIFILDGDTLLLSDGVMGGQLLWITDLDGRDRHPLWTKPEGYAYGMSLSPDRQVLAFHLTGAGNEYNHPGCHYSICTVSLKTGERRLIYEKPGHLMFGTAWTEDGKRLLFQDCFADRDPGHLFSDIALAAADGSGGGQAQYLTEGQACYFATSFGTPEYRSGGSNYPIPLPDGRILFTLRSPGAHPDCRYDASKGNHRELVYCPENARGGAHFVLCDPQTGGRTDLTPPEEGRWDFRPCPSPDGTRIVYTSARPGCRSEIRICNLDGSDDRFLTDGHNGVGADHPRFHDEKRAALAEAAARV